MAIPPVAMPPVPAMPAAMPNFLGGPGVDFRRLRRHASPGQRRCSGRCRERDCAQQRRSSDGNFHFHADLLIVRSTHFPVSASSSEARLWLQDTVSLRTFRELPAPVPDRPRVSTCEVIKNVRSAT
jgi:hypothetical protein